MRLNVQILALAGALELLLRSNSTGPLEINLLAWVKSLHFPDSLETNLAPGRLKFQLFFILLLLLHLLWTLFIIMRQCFDRTFMHFYVYMCVCLCVCLLLHFHYPEHCAKPKYCDES